MPDPANLLSVFHSCLAVATMLLAAFGLGRAITRGLGCNDDDVLSMAVWSVATGLLAAGMVLMGLGLAGCLYRPVLGVLTLTAGFWGLGELMHEGRKRSSRPLETPTVRTASREWAPPPWACRVALTMAVVAAGSSFVSALAPPTAGDALCYHLELPKLFLARHSIDFIPDHENSTFPLLVEMWYLWAMALEGGVAAQLVHWSLGVLLALATTMLARAVVGRAWGWTAGCAALLVPGVSNEMAAPLNDVALTVYCALAVAAWHRVAIYEDRPRWTVMAGLMLGAALGIKFLALAICLALATATAWLAWRARPRRAALLRAAAVAAVVACAIGGPWYARAAWCRGNPVYPFFHERLTGAGRDTLPASKAALGREPWMLALAPWEVTMHPERFGGRGHQLGALFLAVLPGLWAARVVRGMRPLLAIAAVYACTWFFLRQNVRFLFPIVPLMLVGVAWVWHECFRMPLWPRRIAIVCMLAITGVGAVAPLARTREHWAVAMGWESRDKYLYEHEPTYAAAKTAEAFLPADARVLSQEHRAFYFPGELTRENAYRRRTQYDRAMASPFDLPHELKQRGFTHLLLAEAEAGGIRYNATLSRLVTACLASPAGNAFSCLCDYRVPDADGVLRRYRLLEIRKTD